MQYPTEVGTASGMAACSNKTLIARLPCSFSASEVK